MRVGEGLQSGCNKREIHVSRVTGGGTPSPSGFTCIAPLNSGFNWLEL